MTNRRSSLLEASPALRTCTKSCRHGVLVWASLLVDRMVQRKHPRSSETIMIIIIERRTKAVADGALSWYLDSSVSTRVNKYFYGTETTIPWTMQDPEIANRFIDHAGDWRVNGFWSPIVAKVSILLPPHVSSLSCFRMHESRTASSTRRNTTSKYLRPRRTSPACAMSGCIDGTSLHASSSPLVGVFTFDRGIHLNTEKMNQRATLGSRCSAPLRRISVLPSIRPKYRPVQAARNSRR
jgi:hypothetical protein